VPDTKCPCLFPANIPPKPIPATGIFCHFSAKKGSKCGLLPSRDLILACGDGSRLRKRGHVRAVQNCRGRREEASFGNRRENASRYLGSCLLLHADTVEIRAWICGRCVLVTRCSGLTDEVALDGGERRLHCQVGGALQEISPVAHAFPV
jgi:hypothetical protein